jgi:hypothetical protein
MNRLTRYKGARAGMLPVYGTPIPGLVVVEGRFYQLRSAKRSRGQMDLYPRTPWRVWLILFKVAWFLLKRKLGFSNASHENKARRLP